MSFPLPRCKPLFLISFKPIAIREILDGPVWKRSLFIYTAKRECIQSPPSSGFIKKLNLKFLYGWWGLLEQPRQVLLQVMHASSPQWPSNTPQQALENEKLKDQSWPDNLCRCIPPLWFLGLNVSKTLWMYSWKKFIGGFFNGSSFKTQALLIYIVHIIFTEQTTILPS